MEIKISTFDTKSITKKHGNIIIILSIKILEMCFKVNSSSLKYFLLWYILLWTRLSCGSDIKFCSSKNKIWSLLSTCCITTALNKYVMWCEIVGCEYICLYQCEICFYNVMTHLSPQLCQNTYTHGERKIQTWTDSNSLNATVNENTGSEVHLERYQVGNIPKECESAPLSVPNRTNVGSHVCYVLGCSLRVNSQKFKSRQTLLRQKRQKNKNKMKENANNYKYHSFKVIFINPELI